MLSPTTRDVPGGICVIVRVTPNSSKDAVEGTQARASTVALKVRVTAAPEGGKANDAVVDVLADFFDVAKRDVRISAGHAARDKTVTIAGDADALRLKLATQLKPQTCRLDNKS